MSRSNRYSPEVRERAVRMVLDHEHDYPSQWAAIRSIAEKIGCTAETLRGWLRQAEHDQGRRAGPTTNERARIKELERENKELRRANCLPRSAGRSSARHRPISPWRNSTADRGDGGFHR